MWENCSQSVIDRGGERVLFCHKWKLGHQLGFLVWMSDTRGWPIVHGEECTFHSCIPHTSYFLLHIPFLALQTSVIAGIKGRPCNTTNRKTSCRNKSSFPCKELRQKKHLDENKNSLQEKWSLSSPTQEQNRAWSPPSWSVWGPPRNLTAGRTWPRAPTNSQAWSTLAECPAPIGKFVSRRSFIFF